MSASKHDWGLIFAGVALAAAGFFCMLAPGLTIVTIAAVVGAFFLVAGVFDIISYIRLRNIMPRSGWELAYAIIDVLLRLGATEVNLLDHKLGRGTVLAIFVLIGPGLALALHKSRAALAEILANELCRFTPCHEIQPIGSPPAILTDIVPVNGHAKAGDCQAALCGPHFRISSEAALKCAIIQHTRSPA